MALLLLIIDLLFDKLALIDELMRAIPFSLSSAGSGPSLCGRREQWSLVQLYRCSCGLIPTLLTVCWCSFACCCCCCCRNTPLPRRNTPPFPLLLSSLPLFLLITCLFAIRNHYYYCYCYRYCCNVQLLLLLLLLRMANVFVCGIVSCCCCCCIIATNCYKTATMMAHLFPK